jgi:hypothetical protein
MLVQEISCEADLPSRQVPRSDGMIQGDGVDVLGPTINVRGRRGECERRRRALFQMNISKAHGMVPLPRD